MKTDKPKLTERQWEVLERMERGTRMVVFHGNAWVGGEVNRGDYLWLHTEKLIYLAIYEPHGGIYAVSDAGLAALAARRLEREGSGK